MRAWLIAFSALISGNAIAGPVAWECANTFESQCSNAACSVDTEKGSFTPMDVSFNKDGGISICLYSGCWSGHGLVLSQSPFVVLIANDLQWSLAETRRAGSALIALNISDKTASVQVDGFVQPLLCTEKS